jgi:penicillin-binding protein 1A
VENSLRQYGRDYHAKQAAAVVADLDGGVRAMVGGRDYGVSQFNRATDAMRQPGSSFKPYVYSTALMNGFKPTTIVVDGPVCIGNWCPHNYGGGFSGSQPLWNALKNSINTVAVKLSIAIGNGNAKAGRAKIIATARRMGIVTPLPDTPSLPIGADEVNVLEHTVAYATFPNLGRAVTPHAILEVRTGSGDTIWRWDRDGKKPVQALPPQVATDMIFMMNKVVEEGTARRAMLNGIKAAGKTGTTNAYRDAWFVGYTGNFVAGIWFGNDDYSPLNRMTGGSLPAMTWHDIMEYAHQGIELKNLPGLAPNPAPTAPVVASTAKGDAPRPAMLTFRGARVLVALERMMEDASRAMPARAAGASADARPADSRAGPFAQAGGQQGAPRGD